MKKTTLFFLKCKPLLFLLLALFYQAVAFSQQAQTISGRVTGDMGEGLPGVTVLVKGTNAGTTTDPNGSYSLAVPPGSTTLVVSYVGFTTQELAINNRTTLNIKLQPDAKALQEVVVVGYGTQKKVNLTGAVDQVTSEVFEWLLRACARPVP